MLLSGALMGIGGAYLSIAQYNAFPFGVISGRGACHHPDGAVRMATSAVRTFGADAHAHARRRPCLSAHRGRQQTAMLPVPRPFAEGDWR